MNRLRRFVAGLLLLTLLATLASAAHAQVLKQLPADALVVFKLNNPQAFSGKFVALAQKLGLANLHPALADPLSFLVQQLGLKEGFDPKGEVALAMYAPAEGENDPRFLLLIPLSDYPAFLKNLTNAKTEGDLTTFNMPDDQDPIFAANWGAYAAITPWKALVSQKPAGIEFAGLSAQQLDSNDFVIIANIKALSAKYLPLYQQVREPMLKQAEQDLAANAAVNPKLVPVIMAAVGQFVAFNEHVLAEGQAATLGLSLSDKGLNLTLAAEFEPSSYLGQTLASIKNTSDASLLAGLPNRKFFVYGGLINDPAVTSKILDDIAAPIRKAAESVDEAKGFLALFDAAKATFETTTAISGAWAAPAPDAKASSLMQQLVVYAGDAKKLQQANRQYFQAMADIIKATQGADSSAEIKPDAKTIENASFDQVTLQPKFDTATPEAARAAEFASIFLGSEGINVLMGPAGEQAFVSVAGGDDELLSATIASAKKQEDTLGQAPNLAAVAEQLPKKKAAVLYVALDNVITEVLRQIGLKMGAPIPLKLPPDLPPIGVSAATEGPAFRADVHLSSELISTLASTAVQAMSMRMGLPAGPPPQK